MPERQNSGVVVRAKTMAPAFCSRSIIGSECVSTVSLKMSEPCVVRFPATRWASFTATGMPSSGKVLVPRFM